MRMYQGEFTGEEVTELTINVIAESKYAQCDSEGNEYLLLDVLVDYQKDDNPFMRPTDHSMGQTSNR